LNRCTTTTEQRSWFRDYLQVMTTSCDPSRSK